MPAILTISRRAAFPARAERAGAKPRRANVIIYCMPYAWYACSRRRAGLI